MVTRLSGSVMPTISATDNFMNIYESISGMNDLFPTQKSLLFVVTQICGTINRKAIIDKLEFIKEKGRIFPNVSSYHLIDISLKALKSENISALSQSLINILNENDSENIF